MKLKTKGELLASFKKANKVRRISIANKAGFNSSEEYLAHLERGMKNDSENVPKKTIHNVNIVDASGSMGRVANSKSKLYQAVSGVQNEVFELIKDDKVVYTNTLVIFDSRVENRFWKTPLQGIFPLFFSGFGGATALSDAICTTLSKLIEEDNEHDRVLVKIFTDGGENASRSYNRRDSQALISKCKELGITVTFVGTQWDVDTAIRMFEVDDTNTLVHDNTPQGVTSAFSMSVNSTMAYGSAVARGASKKETLKGFYKKEGTL